MKFLLITITIITSLIKTTAFAEVSTNSKNFQGLNVAIGFQPVNYNSKDKMGGGSLDGRETSTINSQRWSVVTDLSYSKALNADWLIGIGGTYDLSNSSGSKESFNCNNCNGNIYRDSDKTKVRSHFSIYLEPEYAISSRAALFAKVGYHFASYSISDDHYIFPDANPEVYKSGIQGIGFGIGLTAFLIDSVFVKVEAQTVYYNSMRFVASDGSRENVKPNSISGIFSIGYKFSL